MAKSCNHGLDTPFHKFLRGNEPRNIYNFVTLKCKDCGKSIKEIIGADQKQISDLQTILKKQNQLLKHAVTQIKYYAEISDSTIQKLLKGIKKVTGECVKLIEEKSEIKKVGKPRCQGWNIRSRKRCKRRAWGSSKYCFSHAVQTKETNKILR